MGRFPTFIVYMVARLWGKLKDKILNWNTQLCVQPCELG